MVRKPMVPADQEDRVAKVEEGETVTVVSGEVHANNIVRSKCDQTAGRWYCATHREFFANQLQKDIHIHTGKHRMAWLCFEHGIEVP